jgi:ABC-type multidrug transport system permease subunit
MRFFLISAVKDLRRRFHDPLALLLWMGIPLLIGALLYVVFGRGTVTPKGLLLVADEDKSLPSSLLAGAFGQGQLGEMFTVEKVERQAGRARMDKGEASALLVIPKGFASAVLEDKPVTLQLVTNPAQRILPGIVEESLSLLSDAVFYLQRLIGDQLKILAPGPPAGSSNFPDATIASVSVAFNQLGAKLDKYFDPLLIELKTTVIEEKSETGFNFALAFFPAMVFMSLMFTAQGFSEDIWTEREQGTLRRVATTPGRLEAFLAGKLAAVAVLATLVGAVALAGGRWLVGIQVARWLTALLWLTLSGTALHLLLLGVQLHASTARAGNVLSAVVMFPLMMMGGAFFPFELMPAWMAAIGRWTPNGWMLVEFKAILAGTGEPARLAAGAAATAGLGVAAFGIVLRRLRGAFLRT